VKTVDDLVIEYRGFEKVERIDSDDSLLIAYA
jgi:hypothetical protein